MKLYTVVISDGTDVKIHGFFSDKETAIKATLYLKKYMKDRKDIYGAIFSPGVTFDVIESQLNALSIVPMSFS